MEIESGGSPRWVHPAPDVPATMPVGVALGAGITRQGKITEA